jgi:uncharacterized OB-fold protein
MSAWTQQHYNTAWARERTSEGRLLPSITRDNEGYWKSCKEHSMRLQRCTSCALFRFYPTPICPECWSRDWNWTTTAGVGTVYTFSWVHRPAPGFASLVPYAYALVELAEGPIMPTNVVHVSESSLRVGMPVQVSYLDLSDKISLPVFEPVAALSEAAGR